MNFLFIVLFNLTSCNTLVKFYYGIPNKVTYKSKSDLCMYINNSNFQSINQYVVLPEGLKVIARKSKSVNKLYLFSKEGYFILIDSSTNYCNGSYMNNSNKIFSKSIDTQLDTTFHIGQILKFIEPINCNEASNADSNKLNPDFFVVLSWATYAGRFNQKNYLKWFNEINSISKTYNIKVLSINTDFIKGYEYEKVFKK